MNLCIYEFTHQEKRVFDPECTVVLYKSCHQKRFESFVDPKNLIDNVYSISDCEFESQLTHARDINVNYYIVSFL